MTNYNFKDKITDLNIAAQISKIERKRVLDRVNENRKKLWKKLTEKMRGVLSENDQEES